MNNEVLKLKIKIKNKTYKSNLAEESIITGENINKAIMEQPGLFAWYSVICSKAKRLVDLKKAEKKKLYAQLDKRYRNELEKVTDKSVEQAIERDIKYLNLNKEVIDAEYSYNIAYAAVDTLKQKKDMLITLASNMRAERDSDITLLKDKVKKQLKKGK